MYTISILFLAVNAIILVQAGSIPEPEAVVVPHDIFQEAEDLLTILNSTVNLAVSERLAELAFLPRELAALGNAVLMPAEAEVQALHNHLLTQVQRTKERFLDQGIDLSDCIEQYQYELDILPRAVLDEIITCVGNIVHIGTDLINRAINEMRVTPEVVVTLKHRLDECRILPDNQYCIDRVLEYINIELIDLPARIQEDADRTKAVTKALELQFHSCSFHRIDEIEYVGNALIGYIVVCGTSSK